MTGHLSDEQFGQLLAGNAANEALTAFNGCERKYKEQLDLYFQLKTPFYPRWSCGQELAAYREQHHNCYNGTELRVREYREALDILVGEVSRQCEGRDYPTPGTHRAYCEEIRRKISEPGLIPWSCTEEGIEHWKRF